MEDDRGLKGVISAIADPMLVMGRVVDEARVLIPAAEGAVVELVEGAQLVYVCASGNLAAHVGLRLDRAGSLSGLAMSRGEILLCDDAVSDSRVNAAACRQVGVASMICVPLRRGAEAVGVLKVSATRPKVFNPADVAVLARLGEFIGWAIGTVNDLARLTRTLRPGPDVDIDGDHLGPGAEEDPGATERVAAFVGNVVQPGLVSDALARDRIASVIAQGSLRMACQPIVDLTTTRLAGVEALARFSDPAHQGPDAWFAEARRIGLGAELELMAVRRAVELLEHLPDSAYLAINVGPEAVGQLADSGALECIDKTRIVIELTEHVEVDSYPELSGALMRLRHSGARVAIDDTGNGFSTFAHILRLAPDIIKLDRVLTTGIDLDPVRRALAGALTTFAEDTGAHVVAEGIETAAELDVVRELGIPFGQGYFLGRPGPVKEIWGSLIALTTG